MKWWMKEDSADKVGGYIMREDSLRTINDGRMKGKITRARGRLMLLDWMKKYGYIELKERVEQRHGATVRTECTLIFPVT